MAAGGSPASLGLRKYANALLTSAPDVPAQRVLTADVLYFAVSTAPAPKQVPFIDLFFFLAISSWARVSAILQNGCLNYAYAISLVDSRHLL